MFAAKLQSAYASKINWTQAVAFAAMMMTMFGIDLPPELQASIVSGIVAVSSVVTWIMRTWFTTTITPASEKIADKAAAK